MIIGIGVDVVDTARLEHWVKNPKMLARFFHPAEVAAALDRGAAAVLSLAARFAAKEAFGKALGTGMRGLVLRDIEVINQHNGNRRFSFTERPSGPLGALAAGFSISASPMKKRLPWQWLS